MTLHQLRTFVAVADAGSVRAAADQLVVTQPAVSAALRALQDDLGVALVEPDGRSLRLTGAGSTFAAYARRVLGLLEEGRLAAAGSDVPAQGRVRIAAVTTASEHVLPRSLAVFRARYPEVGVTLEVGNRDQVWAWLAANEVDVAFAGRPPDDPELRVRAVRRNALVVVAAPALAPASVRRGARVPIADLTDRTWLLREPGSGTRATLEALLTTDEVASDFLTLGSNGAVVAGAVAGLGLALIHRDGIEEELRTGRLIEITTDVTPLARPWYVVTHRQMTPTARLFTEHLVDPSAPHPTPRFVPYEGAS